MIAAWQFIARNGARNGSVPLGTVWLDRSTPFFDAVVNSRCNIIPYPNGTDPLGTGSLAINCQATIIQSLWDQEDDPD